MLTNQNSFSLNHTTERVKLKLIKLSSFETFPTTTFPDCVISYNNISGLCYKYIQCQSLAVTYFTFIPTWGIKHNGSFRSNRWCDISIIFS